MLEGSFWQATNCNRVIGSQDASAAGSCCQPVALRALPAPDCSAPCARESPTAVPADTMGALVARTTAGLIELSPVAWGVPWPAGGSWLLRECSSLHGLQLPGHAPFQLTRKQFQGNTLRVCCAVQLADEWQAQSCGSSKPALPCIDSQVLWSLGIYHADLNGSDGQC